MLESVDITFDGIHSSQLDLTQVYVDSGLFEEKFVAPRAINEVTIRGNDTPYYQGVSLSPLEFTVKLYFEEGFTSETIRNVARWLIKNDYKPLTFDSNPERVFYAMFIGDSNLIHNGCEQGYIVLNVRCNSPYSYSKLKDSDDFHINGEQMIEIMNDGDLPINPIMDIYKIGRGSLRIDNFSRRDEPFEFDILEDEETLEVDNEEAIITTSISNTDRYDNFNENFLTLERGVNRLLIKGSCIIRFRYQFVFLQG
ncbi:distal tail protein Dit [Priestia megaterium]|uniref:distal tail protein Dit n=1 Tax=Priestia megaterium TaxID=1404 RepID=UPI00112943AD|nr:distal tail protein Dit [Priestia megaterium]TPF17923.1 hypothetical protein CBE78_01495 [Priestia megaterium]TPF22031.1 hypothetical protein CBE79_04000 [Priestia megaterium]